MKSSCKKSLMLIILVFLVLALLIFLPWQTQKIESGPPVSPSLAPTTPPQVTPPSAPPPGI